jgi:hypothetical protein
MKEEGMSQNCHLLFHKNKTLCGDMTFVEKTLARITIPLLALENDQT